MCLQMAKGDLDFLNERNMCSACCLCSVLTMDGGACKMKKQNTHDSYFVFTIIQETEIQHLSEHSVQVYCCDFPHNVWRNTFSGQWEPFSKIHTDQYLTEPKKQKAMRILSLYSFLTMQYIYHHAAQPHDALQD